MYTTLTTNQTELLPQQAHSPKRSENRLPVYSPIIMHRIQRADWLTGQLGNLLIVCGRFLRNS